VSYGFKFLLLGNRVFDEIGAEHLGVRVLLLLAILLVCRGFLLGETLGEVSPVAAQVERGRMPPPAHEGCVEDEAVVVAAEDVELPLLVDFESDFLPIREELGEVGACQVLEETHAETAPPSAEIRVQVELVLLRTSVQESVFESEIERVVLEDLSHNFIVVQDFLPDHG